MKAGFTAFQGNRRVQSQRIWCPNVGICQAAKNERYSFEPAWLIWRNRPVSRIPAALDIERHQGPMAEAECLRGRPLSIRRLFALASQSAPIYADSAALSRVAQAYESVKTSIIAGQAIYGVSRGVGVLKSSCFSAEQQEAMTRGMLAAHSAALGAPYPIITVRLAMILKLNTLLTGWSGASPALAECLSKLLSAGITPELQQEGSIGCGDILPNGQLGAALAGQGYGWRGGERLPMETLLSRSGLTPHIWQGKDVISIISHNTLTVAHALVSARAARQMLDRLLLAVSLAAIGLRASPQPWSGAARMGHNGTAKVGAWLTDHAAQMPWPLEPTVHDPLELRFIPQIFGPIYDRLAGLCYEIEALSAQLDENPVVLDGIVSTSGASHLLGLALHLETVRSALAHAIRNGFNHAVQLTNGRRAGLQANLVVPGAIMTGFGPFLKLCGATVTEALTNCDPVAMMPLVLADGLEDEALHHSLSLQRLDRQIDLGNRMAAALAILGAQAADLTGHSLPEAQAALKEAVRAHLPFAIHDQSLAGIVEAVMERFKKNETDWSRFFLKLPARALA
jgi:histidine ammonia-lyase